MRNLFFIFLVLSIEYTYGQSWKDKFDAYDYTRRLGQSLNLGNTLEAPREGDWGFRLQEWHFEEIAAGGFDAVRLPIRWSAHALDKAPYTIDTDFFERIDWVIDQAAAHQLAVVVDVHHYDEFNTDFSGHEERFVELWRQISDRYQHVPAHTLYYELLNEPHGQFTHRRWRNVAAQALEAIRETNPDRMVIVGGIDFNSVNELARLRLPEDDRNLIGTFHYYQPFRFTHQGAEWIAGSDDWLGTTWLDEPTARESIPTDFDLATAWSQRFDRPVFLGEFGAYSTADMPSRGRWTEFVREEAERRGFAWAYWEFAAGFGVMDRSTRQWIQPLYEALEPNALFDVDGDGRVNVTDLDLLGAGIVTGQSQAVYDLDGDGDIALRDLQYWVFFTGNNLGDADLDGTVDFADFVELANNFGERATWSGGDFDASGSVDFRDFVTLAQNFGATADLTAVTVPAPIGSSSWLIAVGGMFLLRTPGRRRCQILLV